MYLQERCFCVNYSIFSADFIFWAYLMAQRLKAPACNVGDLSLIPGSGRSPGEGNGSPLQYSCHRSQRVRHD